MATHSDVKIRVELPETWEQDFPFQSRVTVEVMRDEGLVRVFLLDSAAPFRRVTFTEPGFLVFARKVADEAHRLEVEIAG